MADSLMLDILTSDGAAVIDTDGNQHPSSSSSSSVAVPSQAIPDPISPEVSSSGTSLPRRGFSFCAQPLPALTHCTPFILLFIQWSHFSKAIKEWLDLLSSLHIKPIEPLKTYALHAQIPQLQLSLNGDDDLATLKLRITSLKTDISDLMQQLEETVEKGLQDCVCQEIKDIEEHTGLVVMEAAQKEADYCQQLADLNQDINATIQCDFDIRMEENVKNVHLHVDVEFHDLEKQLQDLEATQATFVEQRLQGKLAVLDRELEKWQHKLEKEAHDAHNVRVGSCKSEYHEKIEALSVDIQVVQARRHTALDAQAKAYNYVPEQMEKEVCRLCWKYLGIKNGPDIVLNGIGTSPEEMAEYETGGPTLPINPMQPDWHSLKSRWNLDLAEAFYIQFCENADNPKEYEFSKNDILVAFENKLKYLHGHVFKATPLRDKSSDQTQEHLNASLKHHRDISRPTQHCLTLRDVRLEIAGNNMNLGDDRVNPGWRSVYEMLSLLEREGISSDESDAEGGPYIVKWRTWHSKELTQLLDIIDSLYDRKNIYSNAHPGNRPHVHMRCRRAMASERAPIRGLPLNFLTDVEKQLLCPEPEMELPAFVED
ncbi:hypothetical protein EDD18DRAFT_1343227 [Armillaria luteobubalina]|uniref:Uncharacterized protein n=1 Tax=Armillaria luteobubalina TaxID=153913 RepID=A0AA39V5Q9_9AGAR|nr:hypothetical protein EDD18DRAFT_1343227 [Armillaria luteobubalina]